MLAVVLALVSVLIAVIMLTVPGLGLPAVVFLCLGAIFLGLIAPFEARDAAARRRVMLACGAYALAAFLAMVAAAFAPAGLAPPVTLAILWLSGIGMTVWAYKTRNRRRRNGWTNYFDA